MYDGIIVTVRFIWQVYSELIKTKEEKWKDKQKE